jgi:hypothetical protein
MGDRTKAKALEMAERYLISKGWRYSIEEIGENADKIIAAMDAAKAAREVAK